MEDHAKLFRSGGSQAVRLPRRYRFAGQRVVRIRSDGDSVILQPLRRTWSKRFVSLAGSAPDFPAPAPPLGTDPVPDLE